MKYEILYKPSAIRELEDLPKSFQLKVLGAIEALKKGDFYKVEKLQGEKDFFRSKRAWPYRILFTLEESKIRVTNILHRKEAYR